MLMITLHRNPVGKRTKKSFGAFAARIAKAAKPLKGLRVLHVNATPKGGGVAELLASLVPYERAAGLRSSWVSIEAPAHFFKLTKRIHNGLQGKWIAFSKADLAAYRAVNAHITQALARIPADLVVIHDPQPLAVIRTYHQSPMVARIHIDCSAPNPRALAAILPELDAYECVMFSHESYIPRKMDRRCIQISAPAIDAETEKNKGGGMKDEGGRNPPSSLPLIPFYSRRSGWILRVLSSPRSPASIPGRIRSA